MAPAPSKLGTSPSPSPIKKKLKANSPPAPPAPAAPADPYESCTCGECHLPYFDPDYIHPDEVLHEDADAIDDDGKEIKDALQASPEDFKEKVDSYLEREEEVVFDEVSKKYALDLSLSFMNQENRSATFCKDCLNDPCYVECYYKEFVDHCDFCIENKESMAACRYEMYRFMSRLVFGPLGKGVRRIIPNCITTAIRDQFEAPDGVYVGFKAKPDKSAHKEDDSENEF
jgi:hypothetical protein